jgi:hypothetical protein
MGVRYLGMNWVTFELNKRYYSENSNSISKKEICKKKICPIILLMFNKKK